MKPIALDAMGGDNAPTINIEGAILAAKEGLPVVLVGPKAQLEPHLASSGLSIAIHDTPDFIRMDEHATEVRRRKQASINVCCQLVKSGEAAAVVSMGHTGASMAAALFTLGRIEGVERPTLLIEMPSAKGRTYLSDGGANVDCRPGFLQQFAVMASAYAQVQGVAQPTVGLLNIGEEEGKGNQLALETYPLLKADPRIRFYGNIEGRDIMKGTTDVVICDGFTGNIVLKLVEGEAKVLLGWIKEALTSSLQAKVGALLVRSALKQLSSKLDPSEYGAMPLLGVQGTVLIGHGSANAKAVHKALRKAQSIESGGLVQKITQALAS